MRKVHWLLLMPLCTAASLPLLVWHFPAESIEHLEQISLEALFETWNPARLPDETLPDTPGIYLEYRHESLRYVFGPFPDADSAAGGQAVLDRIRRELIQRDPKFQSSHVALRFRPGPTTAGTTEAPSPPGEPEIPPEEDYALEDPPAQPPLPPPNRPRNAPAFWLSTLVILAASGYLLRKTA